MLVVELWKLYDAGGIFSVLLCVLTAYGDIPALINCRVGIRRGKPKPAQLDSSPALPSCPQALCARALLATLT